MRCAHTERRALERHVFRAHRNGAEAAVKLEVLFDDRRTLWLLTIEGTLHIFIDLISFMKNRAKL
jgi:hypothetical protein